MYVGMKHLMKYEFRKTLIAKLIILGTTAVLEILFLIGLYTKHDSLAGYSTIMLTMLAFGFLFIGFGTKAFIFPFHPLAADAHAVAPASISLMISGVLTKCGVYGIGR